MIRSSTFFGSIYNIKQRLKGNKINEETHIHVPFVEAGTKRPIEPVHEISNNVVCTTSKASDQPAHTRSLIRAYASRLSSLWLLSYWLNTLWSFLAWKEAAEARLNLHMSKCHIVGNLMPWLNLKDRSNSKTQSRCENRLLTVIPTNWFRFTPWCRPTP